MPSGASDDPPRILPPGGTAYPLHSQNHDPS
jgi:hypothetical protein